VSDLFDLLEADKTRLRAAGWQEIEFLGTPCWRSPDGRTTLPGDEALKRLDAEPELEPE